MLAMKYNFPEGPIECSDVSCQDFTGVAFVNINDGAYVYGACFSQETPDSKIFRASMRNVTFRNCNLMNVHIPQPNNNTLIDCQTDTFKAQNDGNDWIVDNLGAPVKPLGHKAFTKFNLPMPGPKDIPAVKVTSPIDLIAAAKAKVAG